MMKKLLATLITVIAFAVTAVVVVVIFMTVPHIVIGGVMMSLCLLMTFGMVWFCVYEAVGGC